MRLLSSRLGLVRVRVLLASVLLSLSLHPSLAAKGFEEPVIFTRLKAPPATPENGSSTPSLHDFEGAQIVLLETNGTSRVLTSDFASACDPDVSFDGKSILFAGRKRGESIWRIWELNLSESSFRAVSPGCLNARSPIYVSTLFTLDSPEPWFTLVFIGQEQGGMRTGAAQASSLYNIKLDGTELRKLTFAPGRVYDPIQMWDGRLVYAADGVALQNFPSTSAARTRLFAIHIEGADMELYGGEMGPPAQWMPCESGNGLTVFIEAQKGARDRAGNLCAVEHRRPHVTFRKLGNEKSKAYAWSYPTPLKDGKILISRRSSGGGQSGIYSLDLQTAACETVLDDANFDEIQAKVLRPRPRPDGHSTVVNERADSGTFYGLNCYDADPRLKIAPGQVHRVRFVEGVGQASATNLGSAEWTRRLVGEAPVEKDGSFNVEVPSNTPLLLQTLDERGMALATCGWIWVKPKESRGCIGCHEDPERIPENNYVLALRRNPTRLAFPPEKRKTLSFVQDIAPILRQHCATADCHGGVETPLRMDAPAAGAEAGAHVVYKALTQPETTPAAGEAAQGKYISPGRARASWLAWQLAGTNTIRPWDGASPERKVRLMPPVEHAKPLSADDFTTIIQWIDLGAPFEALPKPLKQP